jgi:7 transmembrane receptor (rhodopsin family)
MISFKIDKQLQTISNYFLFSLAIADLAIGLISMPLFTMSTILGHWPLGPVVCDTWLALDYLASNASVLNLLIISFDRYFSVTRPLTYRAKRTTNRAAVMVKTPKQPTKEVKSNIFTTFYRLPQHGVSACCFGHHGFIAGRTSKVLIDFRFCACENVL